MVFNYEFDSKAKLHLERRTVHLKQAQDWGQWKREEINGYRKIDGKTYAERQI